ncbi:MAG TPA: hypothetical protein VD887_02325 [Allosphingosinicella sp.]|nr:hypothetical protein [Allosphingosinicella sp.]
MTAALLILAQDAFVERRLGALFCAQKPRHLRELCLRSWRSPRCGC